MQEFSWTIAGHDKKRTTDWYWAIGLITLCGAAAAIFFGNTLFGIFILLAGGLLFYFGIKSIPALNIKITEKELLAGNMTYQLRKMKGFSITKNSKENDILIIRTDRFFMPYIIFDLPEEIDRLAITEVLEKKMPRETLSEPPAHALADKLGF